MRKYIVITGSKNYFEHKIQEYLPNILINNIYEFNQMVRESDMALHSGKEYKKIAKYLIIRNVHYHGITEEAHYGISRLIDLFTNEKSLIFIHNPTKILSNFIESLKDVSIHYFQEDYLINYSKIEFLNKIQEVEKNIIGQNNAIYEIKKLLWYATLRQQRKPIVIMLYGNSSIGKTELVREISKNYYDNKLIEKHLSMFRNNIYSDYFFGSRPNSKTMAYELLERESNLVFLDEFDKCDPVFYSSFYTMFDNDYFEDSTYKVDTTGLLIFLTSNFQSEEEMKKALGLPIYYRIDRFIKFEDFNPVNIVKIIDVILDKRASDYSDFISKEELLKEVSKKLETVGENGRTINNIIQKCIEEIVYEYYFDSDDICANNVPNES